MYTYIYIYITYRYIYIYIIYIYIYIYIYIGTQSNTQNDVPINIFGFHHKQCASDYKDFTFVKFTSQLFSSTDESLKDETRLLLL